MTQRTWSTTEVSAYLDGQLEPKRQVALQADMEHNMALRRRVEEMQQVVALLRAEPLREPPRNYLLTPSMVAETTPRGSKSGRRMPLLVLRLATSMVTLAFVITFGLTALQGGLISGMRVGSSEAPEAAMLVQEAESIEDSTYEVAPDASEEELVVMVVPEALHEEDDLAAPVESAQEEMRTGPLPEAVIGGDDIEVATGDESPEPGVAAMEVEAPAGEGTPLPPEWDKVDLQRRPGTGEDATVQEEEQLLRQAPGDGGGIETLASQSNDAVPPQDSGDGGLSPWVSRGLGIAAAILAAVTFWVTYQPVSRRK
jgi:hypothetical protein